MKVGPKILSTIHKTQKCEAKDIKEGWRVVNVYQELEIWIIPA